MDELKQNILNVLDSLREAGDLRSAEQAEAAERIVQALEDEDDDLAWHLQKLARILAAAREWDKAELVARSIPTAYEQASAFYEISSLFIGAGDLEGAVRILTEDAIVAQSIEEAWQRAEALCRIAKMLMAAHERDQALQVWDEALAIARAGQNADDRQGAVDCASVIREIARDLAAAGEGKKAIEAARSIRYGLGGLDTASIIAKIVKDKLFS